MIKKADIILFIVILVFGLALTFLCFTAGDKGSYVDVTVKGDLYGSYDLSKDQVITVNQDSHTNKIIIKDGKVQMSFSDCKGQDCVHHKEISKTNQQITCLPNKVMVTVRGAWEGGYDVISN
ncbi:MAG: NusG domain II-containing protein [Clostridia bacterium]|nr:NusG domain II-containing protein [Clostridia bacterium]